MVTITTNVLVRKRHAYEPTRSIIASESSPLPSVNVVLARTHTNDDIQHNSDLLHQRVVLIEAFVKENAISTGNRQHPVLLSFDERDSHNACHQKLSELTRYSIISASQFTPPDWAAVRQDIDWRDEFEGSRSTHKLDLDSSIWPEVGTRAADCCSRLKEGITKLSRFFKDADKWSSSFSVLSLSLRSIESGIPHLDAWLLKAEWNAKITVWPEIKPFWERVIGSRTTPSQARPLFCYNLLRLSAPPTEPNGQELTSTVDSFQVQDEQLERWSIEELRAKLANRQRAAAENHGDSNAELVRLAGLQRVRGTIREICTKHIHLLLDSKPGWLMSPISLANFFDLEMLTSEKPLFDLVIFDEASQVQVMEGLLAMGFAKQTIIVGDQNQLPPTNFFSAMPVEEEDSEDLGDSESLIEEFRGALQSVMLMAHYRSETPDLISFSNKKFYEGKLEMYPPAKVSGLGRNRVFVPSGRFDSGKSRRNLEEAKVVVSLVAEHVKRFPDKSLGVVTMNAEQMDLIEELLLSQPTETRVFCEDDEKFFIRNLEGVQGDEMDRIIVSLTYGKSPEGHFSAAFLGPLTKKGGHRRLNVALSRSRSGMTIVTSMEAADLSRTSAQSLGVKCLAELLHELETTGNDSNYGVTEERFAKRNDHISETVYCESPFEEQVVEFLENEGYNLRCQYGAGTFRIDIVVFENNIPLLAVECDGAAYHSSCTARTRDRARQRQLEKLGWIFHRVWSTNWWLYEDTEKQGLRAAINSARQSRAPCRPASALGATVSVRSGVTPGSNGGVNNTETTPSDSTVHETPPSNNSGLNASGPLPKPNNGGYVTSASRVVTKSEAPTVKQPTTDDSKLEYWVNHADWPSILVGKRLKWVGGVGLVLAIENGRYILFKEEQTGKSTSISITYVESLFKRP